jgi:hypothetical protein
MHECMGQHDPSGGLTGHGYGVAVTVPTKETRKAARMTRRMVVAEAQ